MSSRRLGEMILVVAVCGLGGIGLSQRSSTSAVPSFSPRPAADGGLSAISYRELSFAYSLQVKPDGSGEYDASLNCVMATPEPGEVGCQHLKGSVSRQQVESLWSRLRQTDLEKFPLSEASGDPIRGRELKVSYGGRSVSAPAEAETVFLAVENSHPGEVRKRLEAMLAKAEAALAR